jgi:hypothetical protein
MTRLPDSDVAKGHRLSVQAAAEFLSKCQTREYQLDALDYWRDLYGEEYAAQVKAAVKWAERW